LTTAIYIAVELVATPPAVSLRIVFTL